MVKRLSLSGQLSFSCTASFIAELFGVINLWRLMTHTTNFGRTHWFRQLDVGSEFFNMCQRAVTEYVVAVLLRTPHVTENAH